MTIRKKYLFLLVEFVLLLAFLLPVKGASFKFVKSIGSDEDNYLFQRLQGGIIGPNKDIYVVDTRMNFVARYDWNGKFLKKIGQKGQGPMDFNLPRDLNFYDGKLYLSDGFNSRIAEMDLELKKVNYYRIHGGMPFSHCFNMIGKNTCVGAAITRSIDYRKEYKALKILNIETQDETFFFDKMPIDGARPRDVVLHPVLLLIYTPKIGIDHEKKQIIASFNRPDNPIDFYIYSFKGELQNHFSFDYDKNYRYPDHYRTGERGPKTFEAMFLSSIFVHNGHYVLFISKTKYTDYHNKEFDSEGFCVILDRKTRKMKHKLAIPKFMEFFSMTEDGYIIGTRNYEDTVKAYIYKLEL